jgi:transcriptional regulator of acetoin/glycerol metabolism
MEAFLRYAWPGNLRQLNNVLKTAAIMASDGHEITTTHLSDDFLEELSMLITQTPAKLDLTSASVARNEQPVSAVEIGNGWRVLDAPTSPSSPIDNLEQVEMMTIRRTMNACGGNVSKAAKQLNISRNTIYRKLKKPD